MIRELYLAAVVVLSVVSVASILVAVVTMLLAAPVLALAAASTWSLFKLLSYVDTDNE